MNERIKQLANAADILFLRDGMIMPGRGEADIQEFALLIVADVIDKIESVGFKSSNDIPFEITDLFVRQIKQHFGVEE